MFGGSLTGYAARANTPGPVPGYSMAAWNRLNSFAKQQRLAEHERNQRIAAARALKKMQADVDKFEAEAKKGGGGDGPVHILTNPDVPVSVEQGDRTQADMVARAKGTVNTPGALDSGAALPPNENPELNQLGRDAVDPMSPVARTETGRGGYTFGEYQDVDRLRKSLEGAGESLTADQLGEMSHQQQIDLAKKLSGKGDLGQFEEAQLGPRLDYSGILSQGRFTADKIPTDTAVGKALKAASDRYNSFYRRDRRHGASHQQARNKGKKVFEHFMASRGYSSNLKDLQRQLQIESSKPGAFLEKALETGVTAQGELSQDYWQRKIEGAETANIQRDEKIAEYRSDMETKAAEEKQRHIDMYGYDLRHVPPEYRDQVAAEKRAQEEQAQRLEAIEEERAKAVAAFKEREEALGAKLEGYGEAERGQLAKRREQLLAKTRQDLRNRGLTSSSALESALRGIERGAAEDLKMLNERITKEKMNYMSQLTGDTLSAQTAATEFAAAIAESRWQQMTQVYNRMSEATQSNIAQRQAALDRMLQRSIADTQAGAQRYSAYMGASASRYGAQQQAAAQRYSADKSYSAQISGQASDLKKAMMQMKLGFAEMGSKERIASIGADAQVRTAKVGKTGRTPFDLAAEGKFRGPRTVKI